MRPACRAGPIVYLPQPKLELLFLSGLFLDGRCHPLYSSGLSLIVVRGCEPSRVLCSPS